MSAIDGRQIRAARAFLGLTQKEVAQLADLNPNSVVLAERDGFLPRRGMAARVIVDTLSRRGIRFEAEGFELTVHLRLPHPREPAQEKR